MALLIGKRLFNLKFKIMGETYATDASGNKYRTRKDYEAGRFNLWVEMQPKERELIVR